MAGCIKICSQIRFHLTKRRLNHRTHCSTAL